MAPPCYDDLGSDAEDVFNRGYNFSLVKLQSKTKTSGGMEFTVNGSSNTETGRVTGSLEGKYKIPEYGMTVKEKWTTDNNLSAELAIEDKGLKGSKFQLNSTFVPVTGKKTGCLKSSFKAENVHLTAQADVSDSSTPLLAGNAVLGFNGLLFGAHGTVDPAKSKLNRFCFAFGKKTDDYTLLGHVDDGQEFGLSTYQQVNSSLETGVKLGWVSGSNATTFGLGCVYTMDKDTKLRAKINNSSQIGLGITHRLRDGIKLTFSSMIDARNFNQGGHKLGFGLELEA